MTDREQPRTLTLVRGCFRLWPPPHHHPREMRMAHEVDAARERGELPGHGGDRSKRQGSALDDIVDHRRVSEWSELPDAGDSASFGYHVLIPQKFQRPVGTARHRTRLF